MSFITIRDRCLEYAFLEVAPIYCQISDNPRYFPLSCAAATKRSGCTTPNESGNRHFISYAEAASTPVAKRIDQATQRPGITDLEHPAHGSVCARIWHLNNRLDATADVRYTK
jgi:hypothetical protein